MAEIIFLGTLLSQAHILTDDSDLFVLCTYNYVCITCHSNIRQQFVNCAQHHNVEFEGMHDNGSIISAAAYDMEVYSVHGE